MNQTEMLVKILQTEEAYSEIKYLFCKNKSIHDWKFLFFRENSGVAIPKNIFLQEGKLVSLGVNSHENFNFLDKNQASNLATQNTSQFGFANCVNFDSNVVSYMDRLFLTRDKDNNLDLFLFLRNLLKRGRVDFTCYPYMYENYTKLDDSNVLEGVRSSLKAFFTYKSFNNVDEFDNYFYNKQEHDYSQKICKESNDFIQGMFRMKKEIDKKQESSHQKLIQALILQSAIIKFSSNKGVKFKVEQLFDFFVNELGIFLEREIAICYLYLKNDRRTARFFGKIQKNSKNILNVIEGMSWDLSHIRRLEGAMTESEYNKADFEMHSLATFDNGLKEMLSIYPIKTIAFSKNKKIMIFVNDFKNFIEEIDVSVYWLKRSPESRRIIFEKTDWDQFIRSKESELLKLMN
ncbi:hypothetical protein QJV03_00370 [Listeria swaminathanii]|uniref:Uncharacterized protein n=1 Tax=Listeria swaminathanii TaxID=2713501 RepID=A0ABU2IEG6_9LIST|nr:hypothetical protein [Listeria swaminathanii]MDT0015635.1 hypothetical protein [Listeria swaminathanii]MDT0021072.1 hypothetical protein [Listeria swaminathanii]MDT0032035.1 hypothetical protein [Listeria swaminathanii]MDT0052115.1 hypothetical protein [Listeria swaminathanii]MDT0054880.1 hypothetical protein [Listeria swaminathanii]